MRQASLGVILFAALVSFAEMSRAADKADATKPPPQLQAAVDRLTAATAHLKWPIHHIDQQPSVEVDGQRGYRIVLRSTWKEPPANYQSRQVSSPADADDPSWVTRHTDWHFVLFPLGKAKLPPDTKRDILWNVPDEKQFRLPVALGEGHGFAWFTYASIPIEHFIRKQLALTGGDDPLQLLLRGLSVNEEGTMTRNSVERLFVEFGDEGFQALDQITRAGVDTERICNAVRSMVAFRDARATARLVEIYFSMGNPEVHRAADWALRNQPYRPDARRVYLDMINRQPPSPEGIDICLALGLKEALPRLAEIVDKPDTLTLYLRAFNAYRHLSGKPIDAKLLEAADVISKQRGATAGIRAETEELALARRTIVESPDVEGAAYVALTWALFQTKGDSSTINTEGIAILKKLPRPMVESLFSRLLNNKMASDSEQFRLLKVSRQVLGTIETGQP